MPELILKIFITLFAIAIFSGVLYWIWSHQLDPKATVEKVIHRAIEPPDWIATRDQNKVYQNGKPIADVRGDIREDGLRVTFDQLVNVQGLSTDQPIEYRRLKLHVLNVGSVRGVLSTGFETLQNVWGEVECVQIEAKP